MTRDVRLHDGTPPAGPELLFARLDELAIEHETLSHEPVFTVDEAKAVRGRLSGGHTKNLFLRNKKGAMWLVVCLEDRLIDLKALAQHLGAGRFSFSSADRLMRHLGVVPGAVTPFAVINDKHGLVKVVVDLAILDLDRVNFHPLDNSLTTAISGGDLMAFLRAEDHAPEVTDLAALEHSV